MSDVSIKSKIVESQTVTKTDSDTRLRNAFNSGNLGNSTTVSAQPEDKRITRQNDIRSLANDYKVSVNDIHNFIQKALGCSVDEFYALSDDKYNNMVDKTIPTILDLLNRKQSKHSVQDRLDKIGENFAEMLKNGNTVEEAANFFEHFEENGLFQILKIQFPSELKQYKSADEVPQNVLENCIQKIFVKFKENEGKNNSNNIGKSLTIFKNLLSRTSEKEYKVLLNAFVKVASKEDEKFAGLMALIEKFKNPEELEKFVQNDLAAICAKYNLDLNKTQQILRNIAKTARETGLDSKDLLIKLIEQFDPNNIKNKLLEKQKNGEELSKEEVEYLNKYDEFKRIQEKQKSGEALTEEEKQLLTEFETKKKQIQGAIVAALAGENPNDVKELIETAKQYGVSQEDIIQQIIEFSKKYDDYKVDKNVLDDVTEGEYSKALELSQSNTDKTSEKSEVSYGYANNSAESYTTALNNLELLKSQLLKEKEDEPITLEPSYNQKNSQNQYVFFKDISFEEIKKIVTGQNKTYTQAAKKLLIAKYKLFNTAMQGELLQQSIGSFFNELVDNTKTTTLKNLIAVGWKGSSVAITKQVKETIDERNKDIA